MDVTSDSSVYLIADIDVRDRARYERYRREVPVLITRYGGEYLVRGTEVEILEGEWIPRRLVVVRFPSRQALQDLLDDPDYRPLRALRHEVASSNIVVVAGASGGA